MVTKQEAITTSNSLNGRDWPPHRLIEILQSTEPSLIKTPKRALAEPEQTLIELIDPYTTIISSESLTDNQKEEALWELACLEPRDLGGYLELLKRDVTQDTIPQERKRKSAWHILQQFVNERVPTLLKGQEKTSQFEYCLDIVPPLASGLASFPSKLPKGTDQFLQRLTSKWDFEKRLLIMSKAASRLEDDMLSSKDKTFWREVNKSFAYITDWLNEKVRKQEFDEKGLRTAIAAYYTGFISESTPLPFHTIDTATNTVKIPWQAGVGYLNSFSSYFELLPNGHIDALNIIAEAFPGSYEKTNGWMLRFLTSKEHTWPSRSQFLAGEKSANFIPFVRKLLLALRREDSEEYEANYRTMQKLLAKTTLHQQEHVGGMLIYAVFEFSNFTRNENLLFVKHYKAYLKMRYGLEFFDLSEEEDLEIFSEEIGPSWSEHQDESPITFVGKDGKMKVVGIHRKEFKKTALLAPESTVNPQQGTTVFQGPQLIENILVEENPLPEEEIPTSDQEIALELAKIFPENLSDEELNTIDQQREERWKRFLSLGLSKIPKGVAYRFDTKELVKAVNNDYPRMLIEEQEERRENGAYLSHIAATIVLNPKVSIHVPLDHNGYPQGEIDRLVNEGLLSLSIYTQLPLEIIDHLNARVEEELKQGRDKAFKSAVRRLGGKIAENAPIIATPVSDIRVETSLAKSARFVGPMVETRLHNGLLVSIESIDEEKVAEELRRIEEDPKIDDDERSIHVLRHIYAKNLDHIKERLEEQDIDWERECAERGGGTRVILPPGKEPSIHGFIKAAILKKPLLVYTVKESDGKNFPHGVDIFTTIRLKPRLKGSKNGVSEEAVAA